MNTTSKSFKSPYLKAVDTDAMESAMRASQEAASRQFETAMKASAEQMERASKKLAEMAEQMAAMQREAAGAMTQAMTTATKGAEETGRTMMTMMQNSTEQAMALGKSLMNAKTMRDYMDLQTNFAKQMMDSWLADSQKCGEISTRTTQEAIQPLTQRMTEVMNRFTTETTNKDRAA